MPTGLEIPSDKSIKALVRRELPPAAFAPRPLRTLWFIPLVSSVLLLSTLLLDRSLSPCAAVPLSLLLGHQYGCLFFFGHELSHDAMTRSRPLQNALLYFCFFIYLLPPAFYRSWHLGGHHAHTNVAGRDPDLYGTSDEFAREPRIRTTFRFTPGSGRWESAFYLFSFSIHAQLLLWFTSRDLGLNRFSRPRAAVETLLMTAFWTASFVALGSRGGLFIVVVPMLIANLVVMSYGATNHGMRRLGGAPDQLRGAMSVSTFRLFDRLHFHFSHHTEHHLFPSMSGRFAPLVRERLLSHARDQYFAPPHWKALVTAFLTPRIYESSDVLVNPRSGRRVAISDIETALRAPGLRGLFELWRSGESGAVRRWGARDR